MEVANRFGNDSGLMGKKFVFIAGAVVLIAAMFGGTVGNLRIFHRSSSPGFEFEQPANGHDLQQGSGTARCKDGGVGCRLGDHSADAANDPHTSSVS